VHHGGKGGRVRLWIGFSLSIVLLLFVSRRNLALGMAVAAVVLAGFTLTPASFGDALWRTTSDPSVLLLALIVGLIPLIGGAMETSGEMGRLVSNLRIGVRPFLAFAPALLGMLPMPGGALLSAPLIERGAGHTAPDVKAAANVWFRHALLLVYPLGPSLIASAKIAGLDVYAVIPYLVPAFLLTIGVGYVFLLRRAGGRLSHSGPFSLVGLLVPLGIILAAPLLDLVLKGTIDLPVAEIGTSVGVAVSLVAAIAVGRLRLGQLGTIARRMTPWKYALIVLAMFAFLNVFTASGVPERVAAMALPPAVLCVAIGAALGLITGRIQAPMSIVLPIYASTYGAMSAPIFAVTYFAVFLGYILTPIHPCISVSVEYFGTSMGPFLRRMFVPATIGWVVSLAVGLLLF
jgi:integral membrane protein (TIGR00529 family)